MGNLQPTDPKHRKILSPTEAFEKASHYCAYQERSHKEVRNKLYGYGLFGSQVEDLLTRLITDGFLNEERFAKAFAGGKFRIKKWGRYKIVRELETHGVTPRCIQSALKEIDNALYVKTVRGLLAKKMASIQESNSFEKKARAARFVIGKGYESELVWETLKE